MFIVFPKGSTASATLSLGESKTGFTSSQRIQFENYFFGMKNNVIYTRRYVPTIGIHTKVDALKGKLHWTAFSKHKAYNNIYVVNKFS